MNNQVNLQTYQMATFNATYKNGVVDLSGQIVRATTAKDQQVFGISQELLKQLAAPHFQGRKPDNVFFKDPSSWGQNVFAQYGWKPLTTTLVPVNMELLNQVGKSTVVKNSQSTNNSPVPTTWRTDFTATVTNSSSSTWSNSNEIGVQVGVKVGVNLEIVTFETSVTSSYTHTWGHDETQTSELQIGSSTGIDVQVQPGQTRKASLLADVGTYKMRIDFEARLTGGVFLNYTDTVKGHHFWYMGIDTLMHEGKKPNKLTISQIVTNNLYFNDKVVVT